MILEDKTAAEAAGSPALSPRAGQPASGGKRVAPREKYIGSVRFFKNLIFLTVCILIAVPTVLAVLFFREAAAAKRDGGGRAVVEALNPAAEQEISGEAESEAASAEESAALRTADPPAYQALYPDFYAPQPFGATVREEGVVYLTFDDGPSDRTDEILAILAEKDVKATFFVTGYDNEEDLRRLRDIAAAGHTIGMHSYTHIYNKIYQSVDSFLEEFYAIYTEIRNTTGIAPTVFRFPGGSINGYDTGFYQELIAEMVRRGFVPFDWNLSAEDAVGGNKSAEALAENVLRGMKNVVRGFILLHDGPEQTATVEALPGLIDRIREMGYRFDAIHPDTLPVLFPYPEA